MRLHGFFREAAAWPRLLKPPAVRAVSFANQAVRQLEFLRRQLLEAEVGLHVMPFQIDFNVAHTSTLPEAIARGLSASARLITARMRATNSSISTGFTR